MLITPVHMCWEMFEVIVCSLCQLLTWPSYEKKAQFRISIKTESLPHIRIGISTRNGNASETKANESFDNGYFFDIEVKGTPSIVNKLFSKRSEHITVAITKIIFEAKRTRLIARQLFLKRKPRCLIVKKLFSKRSLHITVDRKKIIFVAKLTH